jgi:hypothetical protein
MDGLHNEAFTDEHAGDSSVGPMWAVGNIDGEERVRRAPPLGSARVTQNEEVTMSQPVFRSVVVPRPGAISGGLASVGASFGANDVYRAGAAEGMELAEGCGKLSSAGVPYQAKAPSQGTEALITVLPKKVHSAEEAHVAYVVPTLSDNDFLQPNTFLRFPSALDNAQQVAALIHQTLSESLGYSVRSEPSQARWYCTRASPFGFADFLISLFADSAAGEFVIEVQRRKGDAAEVACAREEVFGAVRRGGTGAMRVKSRKMMPLEITPDMAADMGIDNAKSVRDGFVMLLELEASASYHENKVDAMRAIANRTEEHGACAVLPGADVLRPLCGRLVAALGDADARISSYAAHALANICAVDECRHGVCAAGVARALSGWSHPVPSVVDCGRQIREACAV